MENAELDSLALGAGEEGAVSSRDRVSAGIGTSVEHGRVADGRWQTYSVFSTPGGQAGMVWHTTGWEFREGPSP